MTQDEIIRMARESADVLTDVRGREEFIFDDHGIERFAALVAEATKEKIAKTFDEFSDNEFNGEFVAFQIRSIV